MANTNQKIIVCIDGTWNNQSDKTNVFRMNQAIDQKGDHQTVYYRVGVGNDGLLDKYFKGGLTGWGITEQICDAYRLIIKNYKKGMEVWLFGVSRGAYAARSLSGFLSLVGVIDFSRITSKGVIDHYIKSEDDIVSDAYKYYQLPELPGSVYEKLIRKKAFGFTHRSEMRVAGEYFSSILAMAKDPEYRTLAHDEETDFGVKIEFLGVWDTVGALGPPTFLLNRVLRPLYSFHDTSISPNVTHAYHALALHEVRRNFTPDVWTDKRVPNRNIVVSQKWFSGSHSNVGGSNNNVHLSNLSLQWMSSKAEMHGLAFKTEFQKHMKNFKPDYSRAVEFSRGAFPWYLVPAKIRDMIKIENTAKFDTDIKKGFLRHKSVVETHAREQPILKTWLNKHKKIDKLSMKIPEC